ncbi:MAG TPA: FliH/SctL family protein [Candidatus Paceibacterota bacterium]|nr:FliH/SctL family protein [Candidatus Paceibacterota bacterium]
MSTFKRADLLGSRELRRLAHLPAVPTTYANRDTEAGLMEVRQVQALRQGYEDGYAEGMARALADADRIKVEESRRVETAMAALAQAITDVGEGDLRLRTEIQRTAPRLAFALLEQLLARELELTVNPGREAIIRALAFDEGTLPATVRMNPADVNKLGEISDLDLGRKILLVSDPAVVAGGVLVEIGNTTLDGQLNTALERVRKVLFGSSKSEVGYDQAV